MNLTGTAPAGWDDRIEHPLQSIGFAEASRALGHRPLFAEDDASRALVLVRRVPIPLVSRWTARAKVYVYAARPTFLPALAESLRKLGVSHVRLGDSVWGLTGDGAAGDLAIRPVTYHLFTHALSTTEDGLLAGMKRTIRRHIRKAADEVTVSEVRTVADLRAYVSLTAETGERMRFRDVAAVYPPAYFEAIYRAMVPRGQAVMFLARARSDAAPLAAGTFVTNGTRFAHIHGCSTRDRLLTPKNGPTAVFWHAMQYARACGCQIFDMGAVTPTEDPAHPHHSVYEYKKLWGGELRDLPSGELVLAPWKHRFQEFVLSPLWDRCHPLYLRVFGASRARVLAEQHS